jgi:alanyl-tRNA synthetase
VTTIAEILSRDGKRALVVLEPNPFRPSGGGQPSDRGRLAGGGFEADVVDVRSDQGRVVTELKVRKGELRPGLAVEVALDEAWRRILTRMHSGEHILSKVLEGMREGLHITKTHIGDRESSIAIDYDGDLDWDLLFAAEARTREIIARGLAVTVHELDEREARQFPGLKANWDRIGDGTVRVVEIEGFDANACCGSHVASTDEVGDLFVTGWNGSAPDWSVTFTVDGDDLRDRYSQVLRRLLRQVGCGDDQIETVYGKLRGERDSLARILDRVRQHLALPWTTDAGGDFHLYVAELPGWPVDVVTPAVKRLVEADPEALAVVVCPDEAGQGPFVAAAGADVVLDLRALLKDRPDLEARGGGASSWVSGRTGQARATAWIKALRS